MYWIRRVKLAIEIGLLVYKITKQVIKNINSSKEKEILKYKLRNIGVNINA